jgi:hypothetical protein
MFLFGILLVGAGVLAWYAAEGLASLYTRNPRIFKMLNMTNRAVAVAFAAIGLFLMIVGAISGQWSN